MKDTVTINHLSISDAIAAWPEAERYLMEAVTDDEPERYLRNVQACIFGGTHSLFRLEKTNGDTLGYGVLTVYSIDGIRRIGQLYLATVECLQEILAQMDHFTVWGLKNKVDYLEITGRKGWEKTLRPYGFTHNYTSLMKRVTQELH